MSISAVSVLRQLWNRSGERLERRLDGLTDAEFFWEPCRPCWTVKPGPAAPNGWTYDYEEPYPEPPPVTTVAWRLVHIAANNWIYWEWAFGPGERIFPDLPVPSSAAAALGNWLDSRAPITDWLELAADRDLDEQRPSHFGGTMSAGEVIAILVDEQVHHGAELALLRDLYLWTAG